jgi:hypothetical protein
MYLDPDMEVFGPLEDLFVLAEDRGIALTPHVLHPMPRDGRLPEDEAFLLSGQFNLGFIAVGQDASTFLGFWDERLALHAVVAPELGYFTDQRWVDFAPSFLDVAVVRDPSVNVAYWNLHERDLTRDADDRWLVNGAPLRVFHYSGYDSSRPYVLSKHAGERPRVVLHERPALLRFVLDRAERMEVSKAGKTLPPYGWGRSASGVRMTSTVRRLMWHAVRASQSGKAPRPPDPWDPDRGTDFTAWLNEGVAGAPGVSRFLHELWRMRPDLQRAHSVRRSRPRRHRSCCHRWRAPLHCLASTSLDISAESLAWARAVGCSHAPLQRPGCRCAP